LKIPLITWQSSAQAPGANSTVSAKFTFDPAASELTYHVTAAGFPEGDILAATIHRRATSESGPAISVLSKHAFQSISGKEMLSDPDRERMMSGGLYLRIAARSKSTNNLRISVKPPGPK
jgi:hypothetical protein